MRNCSEVKCNSGRVRDIEAGGGPGCGDVTEEVTVLSREATQTFVLGTQDQGGWTAQVEALDWARRRAFEADANDAEFAKLLEGAGEVGLQRNANMLECARRGLGECASERWAMALSHN